MSYSLLYKKREETEPSGALYDLSVDRVVAVFCSDRRRADYFMDVLSRPLESVENIVYRQQILSDLRACPGLFEDLQLVFTRYDRIKSDWRELRLSAAPTGVSVNPDALLERTFASLKITAMFPNTIVSFYSSLLDILGKYSLTAAGLVSMRDYCAEMLKNDSLGEIVRIAELFQYRTPEDYSFGTTIEYDATLRLCGSELCEITERAGKQNAFTKLFSRKKAEDGSVEITPDAVSDKSSPDDRTVDEDMTSEDAGYALNEALTHIDAALTGITDSIYGNFYGLSRELMFYEAALQFCRFADERGLPLCTPDLLPATDDLIALDGVRDLILAAEGKPAEKIVPNSFALDGSSEGIIVRGKKQHGQNGIFTLSRDRAALCAVGVAGVRKVRQNEPARRNLFAFLVRRGRIYGRRCRRALRRRGQGCSVHHQRAAPALAHFAQRDVPDYRLRRGHRGDRGHPRHPAPHRREIYLRHPPAEAL